VTESGTQAFAAEPYHFGEATRKMGAQLYLLDKVNYEFTLTNTVDGSAKKQTITVTGPRTQISFDISPASLYTVHLRKIT
jgi:hypothetical protein